MSMPSDPLERHDRNRVAFIAMGKLVQYRGGQGAVPPALPCTEPKWVQLYQMRPLGYFIRKRHGFSAIQPFWLSH